MSQETDSVDLSDLTKKTTDNVTEEDSLLWGDFYLWNA